MDLGVVKNHWYDTWIKDLRLRSQTSARKRELALIHDYLDSVSATIYLLFGKLLEAVFNSL